jgi:hypothetical protein
LAPLLALLPDAVLLGLLRVFSLTVAPKHGFYFTTEAFLIVYACFAVARAVHIGANSHDGLGRYSPQLARRAGQAFYAGLRRQLATIALVVLPLLLAALSLDMATAGAQFRLNVHLTVMFLELAAWLRYGSMLAIASARWVPSRRPSLAKARVVVSKQRSAVVRSLWPAHALICAAALSSLAAYGSRVGGVVVLGSGGNPRLVLCWTAALSACLAWLALAQLSYGSLAVLRRAGKRRAG